MQTQTQNDEYWMLQALSLAKFAAEQGEVPVGAVVVAGCELLAEGWNHPIATHDPTAHAEIIALRRAAKTVSNYRLVNTTLYVTLEPCIMCIGAMLHARITRLVFGAFDRRIGAVESVFKILNQTNLNHRIEWQGGVLKDECALLLTDFFKKRR